jgi:hypothetical protein
LHIYLQKDRPGGVQNNNQKNTEKQNQEKTNFDFSRRRQPVPGEPPGSQSTSLPQLTAGARGRSEPLAAETALPALLLLVVLHHPRGSLAALSGVQKGRLYVVVDCLCQLSRIASVSRAQRFLHNCSLSIGGA